MELDVSTWPPLLVLAVGGLLLVAGRRLFWLAVGVAGFLAGFYLASRLLGDQEGWVLLVVGLLCGIVGSFLAVLVQKLAVGLAGFIIGGGAAATAAVDLFGLAQSAQWVVFIAAGVVCALLAALLFDGALIVLSSVLGATLVSSLLPLPATYRVLALVLLAVLGCVIQLVGGRGPRRREVVRPRRRRET
jgi:hypothetical protein